jgi:Ubiquitin carboxyl-terminal hydrolase
VKAKFALLQELVRSFLGLTLMLSYPDHSWQATPTYYYLACRTRSNERWLQDHVFQLMLQRDGHSLSPERFVSALWDACPDFLGNGQHDVHEALLVLLDTLDHVRVCGSQRSSCSFEQPSPSCVSCQQPERLASLAFGGVVENEVTCLHCRSKSVKRDPMLDIAVDVVQQDDSRRGAKRQALLTANRRSASANTGCSSPTALGIAEEEGLLTHDDGSGTSMVQGALVPRPACCVAAECASKPC